MVQVQYILTILATTLSLLVVDILFSGVNLANFPAAIVAAIVIGVVNGSIKPALKLVSLPVTILSLGAFALVVNGLCFWLASVVVPGFQVTGILAFIIAPVILSFASTFFNKYFAERFSPASQEITTR
ncbi:MAG: phage holin family protein [Microcoleaceae cyanobacterium]